MDSKELRLIKEAYGNIYESYGEKEEKEERGEKEEDCVPKSEKGEHNCAKKVCHEQFGEGACIFGEHAEPDRNGFVSHYDVMFEHGIERGVPTSEMEILVSESHPGHSGKKKNMMAHYEAEGEQIDEAGGPALPGEPGRPGTSKAPGGRPHLPGEKQTPAPNKKPQDSVKLQLAHADLFDIVKGHLMSEGYADTEEAALAIMANMSEEWKQSILSEDPVQDYRDRRRAAENKGGARGPELSHGPDVKTAQPVKPGTSNSATIKREPRSREFSHGGSSKPRSREFTNPPS